MTLVHARALLLENLVLVVVLVSESKASCLFSISLLTTRMLTVQTSFQEYVPDLDTPVLLL